MKTNVLLAFLVSLGLLFPSTAATKKKPKPYQHVVVPDKTIAMWVTQGNAPPVPRYICKRHGLLYGYDWFSLRTFDAGNIVFTGVDGTCEIKVVCFKCLKEAAEALEPPTCINPEDCR